MKYLSTSLKSLATGVSLAVLGTTLSLSVQAAEEVRFTVAYYSAKTGPYYEALAEKFEKSNPEIDIKIEVVNWDVLNQKLTTDISSDVNADMAIIGTRWLVDYVEQDVAEPLDGLISEEMKQRFVPAFLSPGTLNGKVYGLPVAASARAMYYNKDLMQKAGASVPTTWDQLVDSAAKISKIDKTYGFGLQGKEVETDVYFYYGMWSEGGSLLKKDGSSNLASSASVANAKRLQSMIENGLTQPGVTSYNREDVQNLFKQGRVGMMITAPFLVNQIKDEAPDLNYGIAPIPSGTSRATYGVTDSVVLFKNSKHKQAAVKFMDFMFTTEQRAVFSSGEGFLPVLKSVSELPEFAENDAVKTFVNLLPEARFAPTIAGWSEVADITSNAVQAIYGGADAQSTLDKAQKRVNRVLGK
ncbi:MAG: sugar ABC transporter substrate-binding protein [Oceanospirillaceae bacterium]|nr:sugar ABC transporter substrate-binding protein [Oceanospirillaceae bacterium]